MSPSHNESKHFSKADLYRLKCTSMLRCIRTDPNALCCDRTAAEYKKQGGDYTENTKDETQQNLTQWGQEEWQTKEGSGTAKQVRLSVAGKCMSDRETGRWDGSEVFA